MAGHRNKDVSFVSWGEIVRGTSVLAAGSPPSLVLVSSALFLHTIPLRLPGTRSAIANLTWRYSATDKDSTIDLPLEGWTGRTVVLDLNGCTIPVVTFQRQFYWS